MGSAPIKMQNRINYRVFVSVCVWVDRPWSQDKREPDRMGAFAVVGALSPPDGRPGAGRGGVGGEVWGGQCDIKGRAPQ